MSSIIPASTNADSASISHPSSDNNSKTQSNNITDYLKKSSNQTSSSTSNHSSNYFPSHNTTDLDSNNPTKRRNITDFYQKSSISSSAPDKNLTTDNNQSRVDLDETFIVGTSRDKSLRIRIEKSDLTHLTQTQLQHIARDPVDFLTTSSAALLHVFKGITRQTGDSKVEEHFHNTNSNGFCFADVLRQNRYRHCKEVFKNIKCQNQLIYLFLINKINVKYLLKK